MEVIILGKGDSRTDCPFDSDEVWGINDVAGDPESGDIKRIDKVFAFDPLPPDFIARMRTPTIGYPEGAPIVSWQDYADIKYPLDEIIAKFNSKYFCNTVTYAIAYAIYTGVTSLRLYGCDTPFGGYYHLDKGGVEYWLGRAEESGIKVWVTPNSQLLRTATGSLYGEPQEGEVVLYLTERLTLLNLLPPEGHFEEIEIIDVVNDTITFKKSEMDANNIQFVQGPDGRQGIQAEKEFAQIIRMPKQVWKYVANLLRKYEKAGKLPIKAATLYEKIVLYPTRDGVWGKDFTEIW